MNWQLTHQHVSTTHSGDSSYYVNSKDNNILRYMSVASAQGVVPALHIKPDYSFNGKLAKDLKIKDIVYFGKYNNIPIEWEVINITEQGYALLLAKDAIDLKHYNSKQNEQIYKYSKYVNYNEFDVDISDNLQIKAISGNDTELPSMKILNEDELYTRKENSYLMELEFKDNAGIKYAVLPDGNKVYGLNFVSYEVTSNKDYFFEVVDINGNRREYKVPIFNINEASRVIITPSTQEWTNQNVTVSIEASNSVGSYTSQTITNRRDTFLSQWNNYNSYKGRPVRITGSVELYSYTKDLGNVDTGLGIYYNYITPTASGDIILRKAIVYPKRWRLDYLRDNGKQDFDITINLPSNLHNYMHPFFQMNVDGSVGSEYFIKWTDVKYELLDNDGFGIEKIVLPDGREIVQNSYKDTLTSEGNYTYKVYDNNGRITTKVITAKIDKIPPTLEFGYDDSPSRSSLLEVKAFDDKSGIQKMIDPTNTELTTNLLRWKVEKNGTLLFKAYDKAGNSVSKSINISNIDNDVTGVNISKNPNEWTNQTVNIELTVNDANGVEYIMTPSGDKVFNSNINYAVNKNGNYTFFIYDNVGNNKAVYINVSNIDKNKPSISISKNHNDGWVNTNVKVNIDTSD